MAIGTNSGVEFFGTQATVSASGGTSSVVSGAFSVTADMETGGWTNTDDSPMASVLLTGGFASAPAANKAIALYVRVMNIDGTSDPDVPSANYRHTYVGSIPVNASTTLNPSAIDVRLPNAYSGQIYEFYLENTAGVTLNAGWVMKVTPKTIGPKA